MRMACGAVLTAAMAAGVIGSVNAAVGHDDSCPVSTNIRGHENIEWSTAYAFGLRDETKDLPRVLLVGDSICNGYQEGVRERLKGKVNVSYWVSSYCATSAAYLPLLTIYLDEAKYDVIHFNNGLHSLETPTDAWAKGFKAALELIRRKQPEAKIVWCTSTPLADETKTAKSRELNAAGAKVVAELGGIATNDLFALCDPLDRATNWSDTYHFRREAKAKQADQVAGSVLAALNTMGSDPMATRGYFAAANKNDDMTADAIVNGVHGYMPDNYVVPKEPEVRARLEWFKDQKLALMMHFGMYSQMGVYESWPLSDADSSWSRVQIDWTDDAETFKRQYWDLWKSFNPVRFQPKKWARLAKENGFKYLIFTTKHHDGFCLFDTKYTDFKVTNPKCPFSKDSRADIVRNVFDAFRAEGLGIAAYFSKPDWHCEDFWEGHGLGRTVSRMPTYDVKANPEKWAKFREFTKNQIVELMRDYGPIDVIWLDGGQVQRKTGLDIGIEEIIAEARKYKKDLISADRTAGGSCENVITPEQTVPLEPLAVPWESCITMGTGFSYRYDDTFKSPRELVHLLLDVVAKGGNLALNVAPGPDGRLPQPAIDRMEALGAWLKANGKGVYATRPAVPYAKGDWRFTGSKDGKTLYAFRLWSEGERNLLVQTIPVKNPESVATVRHLATGREVPFRVTKDGLAIRLPETFRTNPLADGFSVTTGR